MTAEDLAKGHQRALSDIFAALCVQAPTALDQADHLYKAQRIWNELHPATGHGGDRKSANYRDKIKTTTCRFDKDQQTQQDSFCDRAAAEIGSSARDVQRAVKLAEDLGPSLIDELRGSTIADNAAALRLLAELEAKDRRALITALAGSSFAKALIATGIRREIAAQERLLQSFVAMLDRASPNTLRRMRAALDAHEQRASRRPKLTAVA